MGNTISGPNGMFGMSNGLTGAFLDVLILSVSDLATSRWERSFALWLACRSIPCRTGVGGFDVRELGWTADGFDEEQAFVLRAVDHARARHGWDRLVYEPIEENLFPRLDEFRQMVADLSVSEVMPPDVICRDHFEAPPTEVRRCSLHGACLLELPVKWARHMWTSNLFETDPVFACVLCEDEKGRSPLPERWRHGPAAGGSETT
jgi:hypothetical protein